MRQVTHSGTHRPYRPSNGTEGDIFMAEWCEHCALAQFNEEGDQCMINVLAMVYDIDDPDYPPEWQLTNGGVPQCTAFTASKPAELRCLETADMFADKEQS